MKIEKLKNNLWVPSTDAQIEQWRQKGEPHMQDRCLNKFVEWCETQNKKFNLIVEVGAWCGTWAIVMQKYAREMRCYEPIKTHFECLSRNLSPYNHVKMYCQAIGNEDGFVKMTNDTVTQNTRVLMEHGSTKISKLDSLDLNGVDMLKIDVEGFEMEVLRGASERLKNITHLMIELNNNSKKYGSNNIEIEKHLNNFSKTFLSFRLF